MAAVLAVNLLLVAISLFTPLPNCLSTRVLPSATAAASFRLRLQPRPRLNATQLLSQSLRRKRHILAAATSSSAAASYGGRVFAQNDAFMTSSTSIGSPPVGWTAIIDTGSDLIWRQCLPCTSCYATLSGLPAFDPASSSSFSTLPCTSLPCFDLPQSTCTGSSNACSYVYQYGDNSFTSGVLASDTLTISDRSGSPTQIPSLVFGCGHDNENGNFAGADGLIGLGRGPLSLISQLGISRFSYCLQPLEDPPSKSSPLLLGDDAAVWPYESGSLTSSTPLLQDNYMPTFYMVTIEGITVGNTDAVIPADAFSQGVIFDSGTTLTFLATPAYRPVMRMLIAGIAEEPVSESDTGLDACYAGIPRAVPGLIFRFGGGAEMELPVENYMLDMGEGLFCVGLVDSGDLSIIGNVQQQNYHILYDTGANTLSFTKTSCDTI